MTSDNVWTIPQLADRIGVSAQAVRDWIRDGRIDSPEEVPATGERVYSTKATERIERKYMIRAATGGTRGPGAAKRKKRAQEWLQSHGIEPGANGDNTDPATGSADSQDPTSVAHDEGEQSPEPGLDPPRLPSECPAATVDEEVRRWLVLEDHLLPVVPLVVAVANRLSGPPVWVMIVAPPSSGKSEVIQALTDAVEGARHISSITANTFASGMTRGASGDGSPSLLERMEERGEWLLTIKDFGTIQSQSADERREIFGQLREIYDGRYDATWGTGEEVNWGGSLGLIVGATPAVDRQWQWSVQLGERFVQLRPAVADPEEVARRAIQSAPDEDAQRKTIREAYRSAFEEAEEKIDPTQPVGPKLHGRGEDTVVALANFTAEARRPVRRDRYNGSHQVQPAEGPARLAKIFTQIYKAALICYTGDTDCARRLVAAIAIDSVPGRRGKLLRALAEHPDGVTASVMAQRLGCDKNTAKRELEDLAVIGLAEKTRPAGTDVFKASEKLLDHARAVFPEEEDGQRALRKLCNR